MAKETQNLPAITYYTPLEIIGIYRSYFERGKTNNVVWLRGIYVQRPNQNRNWATAFDDLRDVNSNNSVTLKIAWNDRDKLKNNSLVQIGGLIEISPFQNGTIQISVNVTRVEIIKDQFVNEQDLKRQEIRVAKTKRGFKNVDSVLEDKIFRNERPKVALVFAQTSNTMSDFEAGVNAASVQIDFNRTRQSFGSPTTLSVYLKGLDTQGYDVIALIRGGGNGRESLDEIPVLQTVAQLNTPIICAIGHVEEELFLKCIADKVASTPNGLGQYFSEMVERVAAKRNNSRAALVKEVEGQFKKQIEESNKKNQELIKQIEGLKKQSEEHTKAFKESQEKQLKENKAALEKIQKENKEALEKVQKQNQEQIDKLTKTNETSLKQLKEQTDNINKQLEAERNQNKELQKELAQKGNKTALIVLVAIICIVAGFVISKFF